MIQSCQVLILKKVSCNTFSLLDYEQSLCFLIVRRERSEKHRPRESWPPESCCLGERRKKRDYRQIASAFDLCVAPTTQKCDWLMLDSDQSDDRPKLTGRQDKTNNWIAVKLDLNPRQQLSGGQLSRNLFFSLRSRRTIRKQRDCS